MTTAPTSGHSPFQRAALPASSSFRSFPSTSFSTPSTTSPYVTDQPQSPSRFGPDAYASDGGAKADMRGQTLEEMYSAPENTLEIEVRDPRTQGEHSCWFKLETGSES